MKKKDTGKKERESSTGSVLGNTLDPVSIAFEPDPVDYFFLDEPPNFKIGNHTRFVQKLIKAMQDSGIPDRYVVLDSDAADVLSAVLCRQVSIPLRKKVLVYDSIFPKFASRKIDSRLLFDIALWIAGNTNILKMDQAIVNNYDMKYPVWIPMTVTDVGNCSHQPSNMRVAFFADAGIFAGSTINKFFSIKFIRFVLSNIGVSRRAFASHMDIFGTKMTIRLTGGPRGLAFDEFIASGSQETYNKKLFKVRHGDRPCHLGVTLSCSDCPAGTDVCAYAVRKRTQQ